MNIEKKPIDLCSAGGDDLFGRINLDRLAIPETVKVFVCGKPLIPKSFDCYGQPIFTAEQALAFTYQKQDLDLRCGKNYSNLTAEVFYEERPFTVDPKTFDTAAGIRKALSNLEDLNQMLDNRRAFYKCNRSPENKLHEFFIFGYMHLNQCGQVLSLCSEDIGKLKARSDVMAMESMWKLNPNKVVSFDSDYVIPREGTICPCCGKEFTIEDIKTNPMVKRDGKVYHKSCWQTYRGLKEIDFFAHQLMGTLYKDTDYMYELLPNYYWGKKYDFIPWFLFHTIDGDIIMGWRQRVISIEWQANYKPFDFDEMFKNEKVTKWNKDGIRGIHACSKDDAFNYLKTVRESVNPGYNNF